MSPLAISLAVASAASLASLPFAVSVAWFLSRSRSRWRGVVQTGVMLPLALPPVVVGYLLLELFSPRAPLGALLVKIGMPVAFHWLGAVVAAAVVSFPLLVLVIGLAISGVDPRLETAARTLGLTRTGAFFRVTLPLAWPGILAGAALGFARGLGEFGATIVLAGRIPGETETLALAIYAELDRPGGETRAALLVALSIALSLACVAAWRCMDRRWRSRLELAS